MRGKTYALIIFLFMVIVSLSSGVSATELNSTQDISSNDNSQNVLSESQDISLNDNSQNVLNEDNKPIYANFTANVTENPDSISVQFSDNSTGNITSWLWDFGDGTNSTEQNPNHTYDKVGSYDVSLKIIDNLNQSNITVKSNFINVFSSKDANMIVNPEFEDGTNN